MHTSPMRKHPTFPTCPIFPLHMNTQRSFGVPFSMLCKAAVLALFWFAFAPALVLAEPAAEKPAAEITEQDIERRIEELKKSRDIIVYWKYTPEIIPVHIRDVVKVSQASLKQADMILRLTERLIEIWPAELTRYIKEVYIFDVVEMHGVKGVCMEYDGRIFMSSHLPEYVLWANIIHEASHAVSRYVPLDNQDWPVAPPGSNRYIGAVATQGDPFEISEEIRNNGFIVKYASIDRDEEFAVLSQYLFSDPDQTKKLMKEYPEIRKRASLAIRYYQAITEDVNFSFYDDVLLMD